MQPTVTEPLIGLMSHVQPGIDRDALVRLALEQGLAPVWRGVPGAGFGTLTVRCEGRCWCLRCTLRQVRGF